MDDNGLVDTLSWSASDLSQIKANNAKLKLWKAGRRTCLSMCSFQEPPKSRTEQVFAQTD